MNYERHVSRSYSRMPLYNMVLEHAITTKKKVRDIRQYNTYLFTFPEKNGSKIFKKIGVNSNPTLERRPPLPPLTSTQASNLPPPTPAPAPKPPPQPQPRLHHPLLQPQPQPPTPPPLHDPNPNPPLTPNPAPNPPPPIPTPTPNSLPQSKPQPPSPNPNPNSHPTPAPLPKNLRDTDQEWFDCKPEPKL